MVIAIFLKQHSLSLRQIRYQRNTSEHICSYKFENTLSNRWWNHFHRWMFDSHRLPAPDALTNIQYSKKHMNFEEIWSTFVFWALATLGFDLKIMHQRKTRINSWKFLCNNYLRLSIYAIKTRGHLINLLLLLAVKPNPVLLSSARMVSIVATIRSPMRAYRLCKTDCCARKHRTYLKSVDARSTSDMLWNWNNLKS